MQLDLCATLACLLAASTALGKDRVAVLAIEPRPGILSGADAAALTSELGEVAGAAVAPGFEAVSVQGSDPAAALRKGAAAALVGRAAQMEGATVVAMSVYKSGATAPAGSARVVGIGLAQLKLDLRAKVPRLLATSLGISPAVSEPVTPQGTLRIPGKATASGAAPQAQAQAQAQPQAQPQTRKPRPPPPPNEDPLVRLVRETTEDVEDLRGLRRKQNLKVQILDDKLFIAAVREKARQELTPQVVAAERARWLAFDLAPAAADPAQVLLDVLDEQVAGFYDQFTKQLIVRRNPPASAGEAMGPDGLRVILAHEIEHALQDQNFGIPDLAALPDDDVRLARSALFEGDAMAVMTAYAAQRANNPIKASVVTAASMLRSVDTETLLHMTGKSPALLRAPRILREELVAPYSAGFALVAEAYRRGGFPLVDRMFKRPPESLHQVLHPEAYFAGEAVAPVPAPVPPAGTRVLSRGRMGELGTRVALETCVDKAVLKELAPKWAGDAYTIVEGPKGSVSLLWTTAWSGGAAATLGNVMKLVPPCWEEQAATANPASAQWTIAAPSRIDVAGDLVAVARGSIPLDAAVARQLTSGVRMPAASPPLGEVAAPAAVEPTHLEGTRFVSPRLGLQAEVPNGFSQDTTNPVAEMAIARAGPAGGAASLSFMPLALSGEAADAVFQTASGQFATARGTHLTFASKGAIKVAGQTGEERAWNLEEGAMQLRIALLPWCGGKASLTLVRLDGGDGGRTALDAFAASIKAEGRSAACSELE